MQKFRFGKSHHWVVLDSGGCFSHVLAEVAGRNVRLSLPSSVNNLCVDFCVRG